MDASTGDREAADEQPAPTGSPEGTDPEILESGRNRRRAALYSLPFLALGISSVALILSWGLEPLWAFLLLPPILFMTGLTYLVFSTDFLEDR